MADSGELDFSSLDGMDDIDWSDVEGELQQNREMLLKEAEDRDEPSAATTAPVESAAPPVESGEIGTDFLMSVPLQLTVEVGRTTFQIQDLLDLDIGSILELKKKIGSAMNVLINDKLVAKGEIVVQNEKFAIKLTEIIEESERLIKLQEN